MEEEKIVLITISLHIEIIYFMVISMFEFIREIWVYDTLLIIKYAERDPWTKDTIIRF
jgi:hypothetical protein